MQTDPLGGGVPARVYRRRRLLLLGGLMLTTAIILVAVTRIGSDDAAEPGGSGNGTAETTSGAPPAPEPSPAGEAGLSDPPIEEVTTTEPPTTTTTTEPPPPTTTTTEPPPPTTTTTTEPPPPTTTTTTEPPPPPPVALLTPTGIPVTVLRVLETGFLVRTPCGNTAEITGGERIGPVQVVLDPGHGGPIETGAVGPNGLVERDLNLTLGDAVLAELAERGITAATTRTSDYMVHLHVRVEFADALEPAAVVSIHHNGPTWDPRDLPGTEVYVQSGSAEEMRPESGRLGGLLYEEITEALSAFEDVEWSGLPDAGVLRVLLPGGTDLYALVRGPARPAVLVEYGYLTNAPEAELFATEEYISVAAGATADALEAFLETDRPGSGFVEVPRVYDPPAIDIECIDPPLEIEPVDPVDEQADGTDDATGTESGEPDEGTAPETGGGSADPDAAEGESGE